MFYLHSLNTIVIVLFLLGNLWRCFSGRFHDVILLTSSFSPSESYWGNILLVVAMPASDFPDFWIITGTSFPGHWLWCHWILWRPVISNMLVTPATPLVLFGKVFLEESTLYMEVFLPYMGLGYVQNVYWFSVGRLRCYLLTSIFWEGTLRTVCAIYGDLLSLSVIEEC